MIAGNTHLHINNQYLQEKGQWSKTFVFTAPPLERHKRPLGALNFPWCFQCRKRINWTDQGPFWGQMIQQWGHLSRLETAGHSHWTMSFVLVVGAVVWPLLKLQHLYCIRPSRGPSSGGPPHLRYSRRLLCVQQRAIKGVVGYIVWTWYSK